MRGLGPFLRDAWRLARPYFAESDERWSAWLLLAAIVVLNLALVGMSVVLNFWNRAFYNTLQDKDWQGFIDLLLTYRVDKEGFLPGFCAIVALYIVVAVYRTYLNQWLQIKWRRWMTEQYLTAWLGDRAYYRISLEAASGSNGIGTDNPDQRIAEDLRKFIGDSIGRNDGILQLGLDLMSNVVTLFSFLGILWGLSGPLEVFGVNIPGYMVWVALIYSVLGTWVTHLVGRPLAALNFRQQRVEADFRFALVRLRENVEGIALHDGEAEEHRGLDARFAALAANWWHIMKRTKALNTLVSGFNQIANIFPIVVAAPRFFSGAMALGDLTQTADAFGNVQGAMSWIVTSYGALAEWSATVERLATFHRAIVAARQDRGGLVSADSAEYGLSAATLSLPDGQVLVENASLDLRPGQSVVVTGRSGSGKSTLFRALAGIWPFGAGRICHGHGSSLFLPQRPYIPLGTLRHAVTYPGKAETHADAAVAEALEAVGLAHLVPRLDEEDAWAQRLSGGEQQRLAIARALLARPDWLFLDEATASLDTEAEGKLYALLKERLPTTTLISIAHRPSVAAWHQRHVVLERPDEGPGRFVDVTPVTRPA
jgi:putative ATP-binding cassette transporter